MERLNDNNVVHKVCNEHPSLYCFDGGFWDGNCIRCVTIWLNCIEHDERKRKERKKRGCVEVKRFYGPYELEWIARSLGMSHAIRMNVTSTFVLPFWIERNVAKILCAFHDGVGIGSRQSNLNTFRNFVAQRNTKLQSEILNDVCVCLAIQCHFIAFSNKIPLKVNLWHLANGTRNQFERFLSINSQPILKLN